MQNKNQSHPPSGDKIRKKEDYKAKANSKFKSLSLNFFGGLNFKWGDQGYLFISIQLALSGIFCQENINFFLTKSCNFNVYTRCCQMLGNFSKWQAAICFKGLPDDGQILKSQKIKKIGNNWSLKC